MANRRSSELDVTSLVGWLVNFGRITEDYGSEYFDDPWVIHVASRWGLAYIFLCRPDTKGNRDGPQRRLQKGSGLQVSLLSG